LLAILLYRNSDVSWPVAVGHNCAHNRMYFRVIPGKRNKNAIWGRSSSLMLRCVALVGTNVSEERIVFIIRTKRISELGITSAVTSTLQPALVASYC
jgi:hypothetical protein